MCTKLWILTHSFHGSMDFHTGQAWILQKRDWNLISNYGKKCKYIARNGENLTENKIIRHLKQVYINFVYKQFFFCFTFFFHGILRNLSFKTGLYLFHYLKIYAVNLYLCENFMHIFYGNCTSYQLKFNLFFRMSLILDKTWYTWNGELLVYPWIII